VQKYDTDARGVEIRKYSGRRIRKAGNIAVAMLSSTLPTLVILVLYFVKRMIVRIGLVIVFTAVFSTALAVFTTASKVEIFSATAAYVCLYSDKRTKLIALVSFAAVEVVFIGSSNSTG
jgi:uncharacterized protein DUF6594